MSFKKRVDGSWTDTPNYIMGTSTDTITTLPADIYPTDTMATVGLKGQMEQNGTPTPTIPIQPQECGERTGNLFDENYPNIKVAIPVYRSIYVGDGTFTLSTTTAQHTSIANLFLLAGNVGGGASTQDNGVWNGNPRTVTAVDGYVTIGYRYYENDETSDPRSNDVMLNTGSQPLPYEPFGIKIPISSANTTTPIYLGEVETTRRIKKSTVSITNIITLSNGNKAGVFTFPDSSEYAIQQYGLCDIAKYDIERKTSGMFYVNRQNAIFIGNSNDTLDTLKAIYDGCTLWYVLATPTTGIVNEPIRKIGDYADEVSGITIPTITGANTIDVDTTLKPSEVSVNYHGWHPVIDVHKAENGQWN